MKAKAMISFKSKSLPRPLFEHGERLVVDADGAMGVVQGRRRAGGDWEYCLLCPLPVWKGESSLAALNNVLVLEGA